MWRDLMCLISGECDDILAKHFAVFTSFTTIKLCLLRLFHIASVSGCEKYVLLLPMPSSCFWCESCHSLIWAATKHTLLMLHWRLRCETVVNDIKICIHAAAGPERVTQSFQTHIYFCYRHLNKRSTRDAPNVRQPKLWPNKREDRINCTEQWRDTIK